MCLAIRSSLVRGNGGDVPREGAVSTVTPPDRRAKGGKQTIDSGFYDGFPSHTYSNYSFNITVGRSSIMAHT